MQPVGTCAAIFSGATEQRGSQVGPKMPQATLGPNPITVAVVRTNVSIITGELAGRLVEMMLNSGSAVSLIMKPEIITCGDKLTTLTPPLPHLKLIIYECLFKDLS